MFVDAYAVIVQQDGDGGDSLHREGMVAFGERLLYDRASNQLFVNHLPGREDPGRILDKFEVEPGIYVRHPDPNRWSFNPDTTSRDQLIPVIAYCAAYEDHDRLWRLFKATAQRGFFAQNLVENGPFKYRWKVPDTMLLHLGLFIRAGGKWTTPLYPLLYITDTLQLAGTMLELLPLHLSDGAKSFRRKNFGDVDDNNRIISHLLAAEFKPTPISWLDRQIYAMFRPKNFGNILMGERNPVMGALAWYHRAEAGGNPEIAELYRPLVQRYFAPQDDYSLAVFHLMSSFNVFYQGAIATSNHQPNRNPSNYRD